MNVKNRINGLADNLTATERKLSAAILSDYPFAALEPIQTLAERTGVSPPSISRFVTKLGFQGYHDLQRHLIDELKEGQRSPVELHPTRRLPGGAYFQDIVAQVIGLLETTGETITPAQFERLCGLFGDPSRQVFVIGGRVSDAIAQHLSRHLRQIRPGVFHLPSDPETWPEYVLRIKLRDLFVIVDFRRYQSILQKLAQQVCENRDAHVLVFTDKWMSPVSAYARDVVALPIEIGTAWDSYVGAITLIDALIARTSESDWDKTRGRLEMWDDIRRSINEDSNDP